jgi:hypothetical protein
MSLPSWRFCLTFENPGLRLGLFQVSIHNEEILRRSEFNEKQNTLIRDGQHAMPEMLSTNGVG